MLEHLSEQFRVFTCLELVIYVGLVIRWRVGERKESISAWVRRVGGRRRMDDNGEQHGLSRQNSN